MTQNTTTLTSFFVSPTWLFIECLLLFVFAPIGLAVFFSPQSMVDGLFLLTLLGFVLLHTTPGFAWQSLTLNWQHISIYRTIALLIATAVASLAILAVTHPQSLFLLFNQPGLLLAIALLYPFLSALPQELIFRPLFFQRYAVILPSHNTAIVLNAALFSLAHLMYWSWIVIILTFLGGLVFADSYKTRQNFPEAVLLHSLAGITLFMIGMGAYFYSGNVTKPF